VQQPGLLSVSPKQLSLKKVLSEILNVMVTFSEEDQIPTNARVLINNTELREDELSRLSDCIILRVGKWNKRTNIVLNVRTQILVLRIQDSGDSLLLEEDLIVSNQD